jgi:thioredoxin-like negative regulator of GroEL
MSMKIKLYLQSSVSARIPTLILLKNGEVAAQKVGALAKSQLTAFIDSHR